MPQLLGGAEGSKTSIPRVYSHLKVQRELTFVEEVAHIVRGSISHWRYLKLLD